MTKGIIDPKKEEHYLDKFKAAVEVRNNDVCKALRILKRKLEKRIPKGNGKATILRKAQCKT